MIHVAFVVTKNDRFAGRGSGGWVKLTTQVTVNLQSRCGSVLGHEHEVRSSL